MPEENNYPTWKAPNEGVIKLLNEKEVKQLELYPELVQALNNLFTWEKGTVNHVRAYKDAKEVLNKAAKII